MTCLAIPRPEHDRTSPATPELAKNSTRGGGTAGRQGDGFGPHPQGMGFPPVVDAQGSVEPKLRTVLQEEESL